MRQKKRRKQKPNLEGQVVNWMVVVHDGLASTVLLKGIKGTYGGKHTGRRDDISNAMTLISSYRELTFYDALSLLY